MSKEKAAELHDLCLRLGKESYGLIAALDLKISSKGFADPAILALSLLARTLSNMKGALLLLENGRVIEGMTIVRSCIENAFWVAGLVKEGDAFADRIMSDHRKRQHSRNKYFVDAIPDLDPAFEAKMREWLRSNDAFRQDQSLNPKEISKLNPDFERLYVFYSVLSDEAAHPSVSSLVRYVDFEGKREFDFDVEPEVNVDELLSTYQKLAATIITTVMGSVLVFKNVPNVNGFAMLQATMRFNQVAYEFMNRHDVQVSSPPT